ncbi:MAG: hypothetical protein MR771_10135 [Treponema succinifaciens]|uniref:hypothetical protein n=1 Tax=Treponema succinifaciens TaxID=167 RepID=UPI002352DAC5|nr:hypothetical protein [Treponema succinifaciens]MCI6913508.1 hypothetical protein [Treponema succinifaciens]MDY2616928.1 hypothetical protein [Treponema succinifaciens]
MTVKELEKKQKKMHEKITKHAQNLGLIKQKPVLKPIYDGVADIQKYLFSSPKIMWILKEPYGDFTKTGKPKNNDLESFPDWFNEENFWETVDRSNKGIYRTIATVSYNIQNKTKKKRKDLSPKEIHDTIKQIAFINMSKLPGGKSTPSELLNDYYKKWKDILDEQIEIYKPEIIIFGNTFSNFKEKLGITEKPAHKISSKWCADKYEKDCVIYIDAYHPARKDDDYVSSIIKSFYKK